MESLQDNHDKHGFECFYNSSPTILLGLLGGDVIGVKTIVHDQKVVTVT